MSAQLLGDIPSALFEVPTAQRSSASPQGPFGETSKAVTLASEVLPSAHPLSPKPNTYPQTEHPPFSDCD